MPVLFDEVEAKIEIVALILFSAGLVLRHSKLIRLKDVPGFRAELVCMKYNGHEAVPSMVFYYSQPRAVSINTDNEDLAFDFDASLDPKKKNKDNIR